MSIRQDREEESNRVVTTSSYSKETVGEHIYGFHFISGFSKVEEFKSIFVIVDWFSKYVVFIPAPHACPTEEATRLFLNHVVKYFGLPKDIVNNRDARFTCWFWTKLFKLLGSELKFSTTNHPQTDGQTKQINALFEEYLRHYVIATQKNWVDLVDVAQLSYNL